MKIIAKHQNNMHWRQKQAVAKKGCCGEAEADRRERGRAGERPTDSDRPTDQPTDRPTERRSPVSGNGKPGWMH